jgi:hypothetical protein
MKTLNILFITVLTIIGLQAQQNPYTNINNILGGDTVEIKTLWPFENMEKRVSDVKVSYALPVSKLTESAFEINFADINEMKSAVYDYTKISQNTLIDAFNDAIPADYQLEFEQAENGATYLFYVNERDKSQKIYFLAAGDRQAELLYFDLKKKKGKQLKMNIKSSINQSNPTNHEKNNLRGTATGNK